MQPTSDGSSSGTLQTSFSPMPAQSSPDNGALENVPNPSLQTPPDNPSPSQSTLNAQLAQGSSQLPANFYYNNFLASSTANSPLDIPVNLITSPDVQAGEPAEPFPFTISSALNVDGLILYRMNMVLERPQSDMFNHQGPRRPPKVTVTRVGVSLCQKGVTCWPLFLVNCLWAPKRVKMSRGASFEP